MTPEHIAAAIGAIGAGSLVIGAYLAGRSYGERYGREAATREALARAIAYAPPPPIDLTTTAEIPPDTLRRVRDSSRPTPRDHR